MLKLAKKFYKNEDGTITVDWVVLMAGIVGLGALAAALALTGVSGVSDVISESVINIGVN